MIPILNDIEGHVNQSILTPETVSSAVIQQIMSQRSGQIILPKHLSVVSLVRGLPLWFQELIRGRISKSLARLRKLEKDGFFPQSPST